MTSDSSCKEPCPLLAWRCSAKPRLRLPKEDSSQKAYESKPRWLFGTAFDEPGDGLWVFTATGRARGAGQLTTYAHALGPLRVAKPHLPLVGRGGRRRNPFNCVVRSLTEAATQEDLRGLGRSVVRTPTPKSRQLSKLATGSRRYPRIRMLWAKPPVHQPLGKPERASCETMTPEVARLPDLQTPSLQSPEESAAVLPAATVAPPMRAYETNGLDHGRGVFQHAVEARAAKIFVARQLHFGSHASIG